MLKCKHKNQAQKYSRMQKYGEDILIEYVYCADCKAILSGGVTFVKPTVLPELPKPKKILTKKKQVPKKNKPTKKSVKKKNPLKKKKEKKVIKKKPERKDSEIRENSRKPQNEHLPNEVSFGDILRAKYGMENKKETTPKKKTKKRTNKKSMDDPYSTEFEDTKDIDTFLK